MYARSNILNAMAKDVGSGSEYHRKNFNLSVHAIDCCHANHEVCKVCRICKDSEENAKEKK